jgi:L-fuculose-phosphate aldolase
MQAHIPTERQLRQDMVRIGRLMSEKGWIAACDGNLSARMAADRILVTPAGACKGLLSEDDPIVCGLDGKKIEGNGEPSSELHMHLTIYRMREDVLAVVHAHPPVSTGFAAAGRELNLGLLPEVIVGLGSVPLAAYGTPGTPALGESLLPHVERHDAVLLANHGAVAWGEELFQAYCRMEKVEHFARITLVAELLGGARPLPRAEIETLFAARMRYGSKSRTRFEPGNPLAAEDVPDPAEKIQMTREQLLALIDDAMKVRGVY